MLDDIKKTLWATADKLRANMDAAVQALGAGPDLRQVLPDGKLDDVASFGQEANPTTWHWRR